jgi:hypothetical protein
MLRNFYKGQLKSSNSMWLCEILLYPHRHDVVYEHKINKRFKICTDTKEAQLQKVWGMDIWKYLMMSPNSVIEVI